MARHHFTLNEPKGAWDVDVGDEIVIEIPENATTGFRWDIRAEPKECIQVEHSDFLPPEGDAGGAAGTRQVRLRPVSSGTASLTFQLVSPFRKNDPPARTGTIVLNVS
jgi:inhibitor of cysteine peptidase